MESKEEIRKKLDEIFVEANSYGARAHYDRCLDQATKFVQSLLEENETYWIREMNKRS